MFSLPAYGFGSLVNGRGPTAVAYGYGGFFGVIGTAGYLVFQFSCRRMEIDC